MKNNLITDLTPIAGIANYKAIKNLEISSNPIKDFSPLQGLINLELLKAHDTQPNSLLPLKYLTNLTDLDLAASGIKDIDVFNGTQFHKLNRLVLSGNQIKDLAPLTRAGFPESQALWLFGNPIIVGAVEKTPENCPVDRGPLSLKKLCQKN